MPDGSTSLEPRVVLTTTDLASAVAAIGGLARAMDRDFSRFPVYDDVGSPGNHFHAWAKIGSNFNAIKVTGAWSSQTHSGATAIRAELIPDSTGLNFGGFYLLNGILPAGKTAPEANFGTVANAGVDLSGATILSFWAKGEHGGETVQFFMGGVGRDPTSGQPQAGVSDPDSTPVAKITVRLTSAWTEYRIPLSGLDLHYVLGGFGWSASVVPNPGGAVFYVDDIAYQLDPNALARRLNQPRLLTSYETLPLQPDPLDANTADDIDFVLRNTAFTYDNALAILAFLSDPGTTRNDSLRRARLIGDALVHASNHDRTYTDGRLRSVYAAGDVSVPPGWTPNDRVGTAPVPGFYVEAGDGSGQSQFYEVKETYSKVDVGDNAWAMIALLALYRRTGKADYLDTARRIGDFIQQFRNTSGVYPGYQGGIDNPESASPTRRSWSSTEHNLDVAAAFSLMAQITREASWQEGANLAMAFVESMYDSSRGLYLAGTIDPDHPNTAVLPLDVQAWRTLAFADPQGRAAQALDSATSVFRLTAGGYTGFDFNQDRDGVWFEGTGQMAVAYAFAGRSSDAAYFRAELRRAQSGPKPPAGTGDGSRIAATTRDGLTTGLDFQYVRRIHVGATSWLIFAELGFNPYDQTYVELPSETSLATTTLVATEGQSTVEVQIVRTGGLDLSSSVRIRTVAASAQAGVDFTPSDEIVTFQPGETSRTISIPILKPNDNRWQADRHFSLQLSEVQGEGLPMLGPAVAATVTIRDNDPPVRITQVLRRVTRGRTRGLDVYLDQPLDRKRALDAKNWIVQLVGSNRRLSLRVTYPRNSTVVKLQFLTALPATRLLRLTVNGQSPKGITNLALDLIDGDNNGIPGGNDQRIV